ncbi:MAG: IS3 family transposase, partial [Rhabdochlamydiaceae bacterium]
MVNKEDSSLSIKRPCGLLEIRRSGLYYKPAGEKKENLEILRLMDEQYLKTPFYGVRRLTAWLQQKGCDINCKRVRRLMEVMGWQTLYRAPNTSRTDKQHQVYPYLLKGLNIERVNQVWAMDITYVPMRKGFMYLCAIIDAYSRYVVSWSLSNTMSAEWARQVVEEAIARYGKPEIFNTDQGSQFTSDVFTGLLKSVELRISMDGKGRAIDNIFIERLWRSVKYENIYLCSYE